jgi:tRNA threonylcarbamoyladenosine biosynthesis protein TsaB
MAILLHIDSSGPESMVLLSREGKPIAFRRQEGEREHAAHLNGMISSTLAEAGVGLADVDAFAVCNGPGSYTGLRIGLATAKGFCYALEKPIILHNRLFLMLEEAAASYPEKKNYAAVLPARNGEYFASVRRDRETLAATHILTSDLEKIFQEHRDESWAVIGGLEEDLLKWNMASGFDFLPRTAPNPEIWARLTEIDFFYGAFSDLAYSEPDYLKPAFITARKG